VEVVAVAAAATPAMRGELVQRVDLHGGAILGRSACCVTAEDVGVASLQSRLEQATQGL
jgi:hypothetical protein